jgi:FSR family fosmidomycin resistance protein-like MFS transporter
MLAVLATGHGVNDFLAGWLLGGDWPAAAGWDRVPWLVIYAALAFAGQWPAALIMDRWSRHERWFGGSLVLMVVAVLIHRVHPGAAVIVSGVASAFCHVAGGALALRLPRGDRAIGWFSAPGIIGLTLGGWLGYHADGLPAVLAVLPAALMAGWAVLLPHWPRQAADEERRPSHGVDAHDGVMLLILLALTLRSALWDIVQAARLDDPGVLFMLAVSAAFGKVIGGWMVARWPTVRQVSLTLAVACFVLEFARGSLVGVCAGVALLQATIPSSIVLLNRSFGTSAARASAFGLGVTVAVGGLLVPLRLDFSILVLAATATGVLLFRPFHSHPAPSQ